MKNTKEKYNTKRLICLTPEIDEMLTKVTNASYTNKSQKLRSLILEDYNKLSSQMRSFQQPFTRNI